MELSTTLPLIEAEPRVAAREQRKSATRVRAFVHWLLIGIAAVFWAFHLVHLRADFPNHSQWSDWAKYTDEGWYGDAAIRHYHLGHWNVKGDFNPAAALPVWPFLELIVFRFTGVSIVAARVLSVFVFGLILMVVYAILRRWQVAPYRHRDNYPLGAALAVCLLAVSPFCFVFVRLAILEPLLVLWGLCGLLVAPIAGEASSHRRSKWGALGWPALLGAILAFAVLTKTTAAFLVPSVLYLLWASCRYKLRPFVRTCLIAGITAALLWGGYMVLFVRPRYLDDYKYLFAANSYTGITAATFWSVIQESLRHSLSVGAALVWVGAFSMVFWMIAAIFSRQRSKPIAVALVLWIVFYGAFVTYHDNLAPRYYLAVAVPLTMLVALTLEALLGAGPGPDEQRANPGMHRLGLISGIVGTCVIGVFAVTGAAQIVHYIRHPEFTFLTAAHRVRDAIDREAAFDPRHSKLLLSISGSDISLMTGIPSICDDFGTMELPDRVAAYKPGWFATWNDVEDDKMEALAPMYKLVRVGAYPAFDDPDRNLLILYRLDPINGGGAAGRGRRTARNRRQPKGHLGERPSAIQLQH